MRGILEANLRSTDHPAMQRYASRPGPAKVVEVVAEVFQTPADAIRNGHGIVEREVVAWLGCDESMAQARLDRRGASAAEPEPGLGSDRHMRSPTRNGRGPRLGLSPRSRPFSGSVLAT